MGLPAGLEYKDVGALITEPPPALAGPEAKGIVDAIVAVTGVVDDVNDHIIPGAFRRTLAERLPKVCLGHDWNRPIGKTLQIKELMPGDPGLPKITPDGKPWPKEAGAVLARSQYNLATKDGRDAFEQAKFYLDTGQSFQSIGYKVTPEGKSFKRGIRYITDLDLYEYGPVLHPANRLAAALGVKGGGDGREDNALHPDEAKARKYVKDSSYWGLPVGTPITPGMKPRGRTALAERRQGKVPDRNAGVVAEPPKPSPTTGKPRSVAHKPEKAKQERDAAGLFPEPDAPEGARVKPSDPAGIDAEHVQALVENEAGNQDHVARDEAIIGLIDEGITPAELEEDMHASEHWPDDMSEEDRKARIDDVVNDYRRQYRREAARQANDTGPREQHPEDDNLAVEKEQRDTAENGPKPEDDGPDPSRAKGTIADLSDEELDKYIKTADRGAVANIGEKQRRFQAVGKAARDEKLRRADAARRSVPAHPLDPKTYEAANRAVEARRSRAADVQKRNTDVNRINAQIDDSEAAAAAAPETMKKLPAGAGQKVSKAGNGRVAFRGRGTANWAILSADGRAIVSPAAFEGEGRANVKLSGPQLDELADRIAGITNAKGDRAPFTDPESEKWVPGFRDSDGRSLEQAVSKVVADYANERGLKPGTRTRMGVDSTPWGHKQGPAGVVNDEGFHPQERIQDVGPGDQVKLRNGDVKTIKAVTEDNSMQRDRYGHNVFEIEFDDGDKQKFSDGQRFDTKYSDENNPDREGGLNDPGMGYTSDSNLGSKRDTRIPGESNVPAGTRFIYTPDRPDGDNRPRVGTVTDRTMLANGREFQVVEYDDGTFDGVNVSKLAADGKINLKPTPEDEADARSQWGVQEATPEGGPDAAGEPDGGTAPGGEGDGTTPPEGGPDGGGAPEGEQPPAEGEQPPAGDGQPPVDDQAARVEQLGAADNPDRTPIAGLANQLTGQNKPDVSGISTEDLGALDQEFSRRAQLLGKPDGVTRAHQAVRDELATRTDTGAEPAPEPDGGLGENEAVISRAEVDDAQRTADEVLGISEGPDGELEADPDVADRQDRVESLLDRAETGVLDLSSASDDEVGNERRELVDELRFQNAIATRDRRRRQIEQTEPQPGGGDQQGDGTGGNLTIDGADGGTPDGEQPPEPEKPKVRPGVAGAAEDLADALEADDQQARAAALARLESSIRRSRSDSEHLGPLRDALARDGGIQAAIDAGDVTPTTLRDFAKNLRDERRQQSNERARDRRKVKRLERERLRGLIGEYDAELRRRNLDPDKFGGTVPEVDDNADRPDLTPAPDEVEPPTPDGGTAGAEPTEQQQRAQRLQDEPWRLLGGVGSGETTGNPNSRAAANAAFADVATKYAPVLRDATPEQLATISAAIGAKNPDADQTEAMFIGLLLPEGPQRRAFMNDMRTAMGNYRTNLAALRARTDRGELNPEPAPELASIAPGRVGWDGRLNALAPRARADKPAGEPPFASVSQVTSHLKTLTPSAGASEYDQKQFAEGRDQLIREIDAAGNDVFLSPGGGLLAYRVTTRDGKRWFLIHTQTGQSIPSVFVFGRTQKNLTPATGRGVDAQRYDLDGPAMRRLMSAFETMQDPRGRQVDFTESDPDRFTQSLLGWRDFSADGAVRPAFSNGEARYTDSMEGAAILEATREDMRRYGTTSAVHRATQMVSEDTKYSGVNGRSPQQYRQLMEEQFPFALQDYNYGRKRVRGLGPSEDRSAAQLKSDKDTAAAIDQARALVQTGSPAEAVSVLRARAAELKDTDAERGSRFGSPRLERLADGIADLYSPAQSDMDRLVSAQNNDVIAVPTTGDEPPMIYRITQPPELVLTRSDGTRTYRMRVTSKDGDQDATIDTAGQYGVMIGDQYGDRYGNNQATNLGQSSIGQWSVYRAEDGQGTPTDNKDILRDSRRTIAEFDRAAGFRNDDEGGDTGGGGGGPEPGPDGGPDETGGERPVAAEGKAITVADAKLGDLVAIPSGDDGPSFVGHVLSKDTSGAIDGLSVVDGNGNQRVLPLDREGLIHRIDVVDDDVAGRLPDFDGEPTLTVGSVFEALPQLPEGTPVRITSGTDDEYRTVATGIVTLGPGGAYYVRTPDGRLLSTASLVDDRGRPGRVEMVVDPKDFTGEDDKFPLSSWPAIKVEPGDKVQVYVEMEDPSAPGGVRSRWANGWVENVETMNSSLDRPITRSVLVRLPSGAAVTISGNEADQAGRSNKLRRKGKSTKATRAAVEAAGVRATRRPSAPTQLTGSVMAINAMVNSNVMMALDGSDSRIGRKGLPSERLRRLAELVRADPVVIDKLGSASLYNGEIRTPNAIPRVFAGASLTGATEPGELPEASNQEAAKFLKDFTLRLIDSAIDTATEFEQVDQDDQRVTNAVRSVFQSRRLQESATDTLAAAYRGALDKLTDESDGEDVAPDEPLRRRAVAGVGRAYHLLYDEVVLGLVNAGRTDSSPKEIETYTRNEVTGGPYLKHLNDLADATEGDSQAYMRVRDAIAAQVAEDVFKAQAGGNLKAEWETIIDNRASGTKRVPTVPPKVQAAVDEGLTSSSVLAKVDPAKPFTGRVAALRAQLPPAGKIGQRKGTRYGLVGDVLDGKLDFTAQDTFIPDIDPDDKGPGREAMRHLAVLRAIGNEVRAESRERVRLRREADAESQKRLAGIAEAKAKADAADAEVAAVRAKIEARIQGAIDSGELAADSRYVGVIRAAVLADESNLVGALSRNKNIGKAAADFAAKLRVKMGQELGPARNGSTLTRKHTVTQIELEKQQADVERRWLVEARRDALADVRDLGAPGDIEFEAGQLTTLTPERLKNYTEWAAAHYPKEWLARGRTLSYTQLSPRGFYNSAQDRIELSSAYSGPSRRNDIGGPYGQVTIHEYGHHMEEVTPGLLHAEWMFHFARTSTGPVGRRQREEIQLVGDVQPGGGYGPDEVTMPDEFKHPYSGKFYNGDGGQQAHAWELFTMGMESLFAESEHLDDDYENWMLGVLAGV